MRWSWELGLSSAPGGDHSELRQSRRDSLGVRDSAETKECRACRTEIELTRLAIAPKQVCLRQERLRPCRLVGGLELLPEPVSGPQADSRLVRSPRGELERAARMGRCCPKCRQAVRLRGFLELGNGLARRIQVPDCDQYLHLARQQSRAREAVERWIRKRGLDRRARGQQLSLREPKERDPGLRCEAQLVRPHERFLCPGEVASADADLTELVRGES